VERLRVAQRLIGHAGRRGDTFRVKRLTGEHAPEAAQRRLDFDRVSRSNNDSFQRAASKDI
jgi:hypothetical protein